MSVKEIFKYLRQINSLSQEQVAEKLGISRQTYIKYENGTVIPGDEIVRKVSLFYKVSESVIRENKIPQISNTDEISKSYKINHSQIDALVVADSGRGLKNSTLKNRKSYTGIFDGNAVRVLENENFKAGQRFILVAESDDEARVRREAAFEVLQSFRGTLRKNFDYKAELEKMREQKYERITGHKYSD